MVTFGSVSIRAVGKLWWKSGFQITESITKVYVKVLHICGSLVGHLLVRWLIMSMWEFDFQIFNTFSHFWV